MSTPQDTVMIPLNKLVRSALNVRKTGGQSIDDLASSIHAHGLIHNLTVTEHHKNGKPTGKWEAVAGARRLAALQLLAKQKKLPRWFLVPCLLVEVNDAPEVSLAENTIRQAMHPADQFECFRDLVDQGNDIEEIAARFGVTATTVRQRLKLANVAPRLFELYRQDQINLDQLMALAVTDDHSAQESVWDAAQGWQKEAQQLRRALTASKIDAARDPAARFVGVHAYLDAGGDIERDLFQPEHEGYLVSSALLQRLTSEKLADLANEVRSEGWKWVEILPSADYSDLAKFGRIYPVDVEATPEIRSESDALQAEREQLEQAHQHDSEDFPQDIDERMYEIEERIDALNGMARQYTEEQKKLAGAIVSIETIHRGLVHVEDKRQVEALRSGANAEDETSCTQESESPSVSQALTEELTAQRTVALRVEMLARPDIALVAITHRLAGHFCYSFSYDPLPTAVMVQPEGYGGDKNDLRTTDGSKAAAKLREHAQKWKDVLPENSSELWDWLIQQPQSVVLDLLAYSVALTINGVQSGHVRADSPRLRADDALSQTLALDMSIWWQPTAENCFNRIKKGQILAAIAEAEKKPADPRLAEMKKVALAEEAEKRLAGTGWLPQILRS